MSIVVCKLPDAGLGNQLFPLTRAMVFSHLNHLPLIVTGYHRLKPGPYLRGEKNKRKYRAFFNFQKGYLGELGDKLRVNSYKRKYAVIKEPSISSIAEEGDKLYYFTRLSHYSDYFNELKDHRELAISLLKQAMNPVIFTELQSCKAPDIAVHIRMGDFRKLKPEEDFNKVGSVRTPLDYFIEMIRTTRSVSVRNLPVRVFTDGHPSELKELFELPETSLVKGNTDMTDLLLMSKSKVIITSAGSTFSYWAGFLSEAVLIMHHAHIYASIRPPEINKRIYEGAMVPGGMDQLLLNNLQDL